METLKKYLVMAGALLVVYGVGLGMGYYMAPSKVKESNKTDSTDTKETEKTEKVTEKFDPVTGKVIEKTTETGTKKTNTKEKSTEKTVEKTKDSKLWAVKLGVAKTLTNAEKPFPRLGAEVRIPFFNSWVGAEADIKLNNPTAGAYLRLEF